MSYASALEAARAIKEGETTSQKLTQAAFDAINQTDQDVSAYVSLLKEEALEQATRVDARIKSGECRSPLAGVPIGIKDNLNLKGSKTTCSSKMLENFVSPYTATAVQKVIDADLIPVGKLNMDEFAMGSSTENSAFFTTKNPWNLDCVPGGSSGGSAATVASNQVLLSLGSDTGGSIRQPAAFCGVVGFKPTYGRVSRYGLVAFASSLDQIGPFSRTIEDTAHVLSIICGHDAHDSTSLQMDVPDFSTACMGDVKGLKIAVPEELFGEAIDEGVRQRVQDSLDLFVEQGASYDIVSMTSFNAALASYYIIAPAEASANLARFDGVRYTHRSSDGETLKEMIVASRGEAFGEEVKRRIMVGTFALSSGYYDAFYVKAQKARTVMRREFDRIFSDYDVVLSPTTPSVAFPFGAKEDPMQMYLNDSATIPANMAGLPAVSLPCGFSDGMPVGLQLVGKPCDEAMLIKMGYAFQQQTDFHKRDAEGFSR
ncbi:Asp-tRNA(Asn)/Glu-tRNA(Gln) amidotransferase GatCAB subunit A [Candidatus Marinamargulisbacteria bacterium SCGC AG-343-D04]|nr:Asp-tRNA(Asn)/Glu-tRNA(Gln) amidotransferase GatCAB subunit A [Candidatus Marinamargulisbacteria bacterium SCGC AG-343-D04]